MNRTYLKEILSDHGYQSYIGQLYTCNARIYTMRKNGKIYVVLRSYRTNVAVYDTETNLVYTDGYYSATTCKHVRKFAGKMGAKGVEKLYIHSGMRKAEKEHALATDFEC